MKRRAEEADDEDEVIAGSGVVPADVAAAVNLKGGTTTDTSGVRISGSAEDQPRPAGPSVAVADARPSAEHAADGGAAGVKRRKVTPAPGVPAATPSKRPPSIPPALRDVPQERLADELEKYNFMLKMFAKLRHPWRRVLTHPQDQQQMAYWAKVFQDTSKRVTLTDPPVQHVAALLRYRGRQYQHPSHVVCHLIHTGVLVGRAGYLAPLDAMRRACGGGSGVDAAQALDSTTTTATPTTALAGLTSLFAAAGAGVSAASATFGNAALQFGAWGLQTARDAFLGGPSAARPETIEQRGDYVNILVVMKLADALYEHLKKVDVARDNARSEAWEHGLVMPHELKAIAGKLHVHRSDLDALLAFLYRSGKVQLYPARDGGWGLRIGAEAHQGDAAAIHLLEEHAELQKKLQEKRAELKALMGDFKAGQTIPQGKRQKAALFMQHIKSLDDRVLKLEQLKDSVRMARLHTDSLAAYKTVRDELSRMNAQNADAGEVVAAAAEAVATVKDIDEVLAQPIAVEDPDELAELDRELAALGEDVDATPAAAAKAPDAAVSNGELAALDAELDALSRDVAMTPTPARPLGTAATPASAAAAAAAFSPRDGFAKRREAALA